MIKTYWMCVLVQEGDDVIRTGVLSLYPIITIFFLFIFFVYFLIFLNFLIYLYIQNIYISIVIGVTEGSNGPWMFNYGRIFMELVRHIEIIVY